MNDPRTPEFPLADGAQAAEGRGWFAWARPGWAWGIPVLLLLGPFLLWPLGAILWRGLAPDGSLSLTAVTGVLGDRFYWERLLFTFAQAMLSTALSLLVGLPAAYVFATMRFPGRDVLLAIVTVPFVLPTVVAALAFQELLGPTGWFNDVLGWFGVGPVDAVGTLWVILLAHVFYELSIVIRLVSAAWVNLHPQNEEAARLLGAGRIETFRYVTLPALAPAIAAAAALVFTFTFTSFGVVLLLGGPGLDTLEVVIYRLATQLVALPAASVLAVVQIVTTVATLTVYALLQRRGSRALRMRRDRSRPLHDTTRAERFLLGGVGAVLVLLVLAPLAALVHASFTVGASGIATFGNYTRLFEDTGRISFIDPVQAARWSLTFAVGASLLALVTGAAAATALARHPGRAGAIIDGLLMLPLAVPAVVLGFGYLTTFNRDPFDLRGSPWLVVAAHALIAYPFVLRAVLAVLRTIDPRLPEAASVLGATRWGAWRHVELPLATRALLVGAVFAFAISLGEFGATLTLQPREYATLPVAIYKALGRPGAANLGQALAMATVLMTVTAASFLALARVRYRDVGEF